MSALRKRLARPHTYLAVLLCLAAITVADSYRAPSAQWTARAYVSAVRAYQSFGRPIAARFIQCRYRPTCSEYSRLAVETHGIQRGLALTYHRLASCTTAVPLGSEDPVPLQ